MDTVTVTAQFSSKSEDRVLRYNNLSTRSQVNYQKYNLINTFSFVRLSLFKMLFLRYLHVFRFIQV